MYTKDNLVYYKDDIARIDNFVTPEQSKNMIEYFESMASIWGDVAFYGSKGMGFADTDPRLTQFNLEPEYFKNIRDRFKQAVELMFEKDLKPNTSHAQKWDVGGFAAPHSDNSDHDGNPNAFEINKYVGILYLNDNYEGGELYFPDHSIEFKPPVYSYIMFPGGHENIHGVKEILKGTRYTMVSFWDYADAIYSQETLDKWKREEEEVRRQQAIQKVEWEKGNKNA